MIRSRTLASKSFIMNDLCLSNDAISNLNKTFGVKKYLFIYLRKTNDYIFDGFKDYRLYFTYGKEIFYIKEENSRFLCFNLETERRCPSKDPLSDFIVKGIIINPDFKLDPYFDKYDNIAFFITEDDFFKGKNINLDQLINDYFDDYIEKISNE